MKKLGKAVLFCLILTLLLALFNKILMPDTQFRADTKELGSEVDYIFLGTSNVFYCVNPVIIWNEKGYTGYSGIACCAGIAIGCCTTGAATG